MIIQIMIDTGRIKVRQILIRMKTTSVKGSNEVKIHDSQWQTIVWICFEKILTVLLSTWYPKRVIIIINVLMSLSEID